MGSPLSTTELASMQAESLRMILTQRCSILRIVSPTEDPEGGVSKKSGDYTAVSANVPCAVLPGGSAEQFVSEMLTEKGVQTILLPAGTDIEKQDRIAVNDGTKYHVIGIVDPTVNEIVRRVIVGREAIPVT